MSSVTGSPSPMTARAAGHWLWLAGLLLVPLPLLAVTDGSIPVLRFALLGSVSAAYAATVDGSGVAWVMTAILWAHALVYALLLAAAAALAARLLPERLRRGAVWALVGAGFLLALGFELYRTPFAEASARSAWLGLLR